MPSAFLAPGLALVHADAALLAFDKPAGLLAVPGRGADKQDSLAARVQRHFPDALVVHRLDEATSGLMLFARGPEAQRRLSRAFEERRIDKRYVAVVHGRVAAPPGEWRSIELPLAADWPNRPRQRVDALHGRPSLTRWRALAHDAPSDTTRLELQPLTGRSHQLRVHLQALGHPIVGDRLYAAPRPAARLHLHAARLAFEHPAGSPLVLESPVPF